MAGAVVSGLTGNPAFPNPTVDLKAAQAASGALAAALVAQAQGGKAATAEPFRVGRPKAVGLPVTEPQALDLVLGPLSRTPL